MKDERVELGYLVQLVVILNTGYILSKLPKKCQFIYYSVTFIIRLLPSYSYI